LLSDVKYTIKQSAVYGLSRVSIKLVAFILFPLYSVYFSVEQYGIIVRGEIFWQLFQSALFFAIETAIIRWYSLSKDTIERKSLLFTVSVILIIINLIILSATLLFTKSISQLVFNSSDYQVIVVFCVLISLSETLIGIPLLILRIEERASKYSFVVMTSSVISMLAQVYFIIYTNYKLEGIFLSKVIAPSLIFLSLIPILTRSLELKFNNIVAKEVLIFCYP